MRKSGYGFEVLSSKLDYESPFMRVFVDKIKYPDGRIKSYWTLNRYSNFSIIVPLFPGNETILVGQYRVSASWFSWEFPMGRVIGKNALAMAKQELLEETGYKAKKWNKIGEYFTANGHSDEIGYFFAAEEFSKVKSSANNTDEFLKIKKVKLDKVGRMIQNGRIKDGATIVAYHFLEKYLNKDL